MKTTIRYITRLIGMSATILGTFACAPTATVNPPVSAGVPARATSSSLQPVAYRPEFGTMWTFDAPPLEYWRRTYNFSPDKAWLDRVRLAAIRLPNCSASFVSETGLAASNHHCLRECAAETSPRDTNYIETGFVARTMREEKKCPGLYVDRLESMQDVTSRVRAALTAATPVDRARQRAAITSQIEAECRQQTQLTCQVVSLYSGGMYSLYRYKRFDDLRLVFVPEESVAAFGGDPDNFTYPRYDLDASLFRVYVNGKPYTPENYLPWRRTGPVEDELVFVVGNPGSTGRLNTLAQMEFLRDVGYPSQLASYKRALAIYDALEKTDSTAARRNQNNVFSILNSQKAVTGYRGGLTNSEHMATKTAFEREFQARIAADPKLRARYGNTYRDIATAQRELGTFDAQRRYHSFGPSLTLGGSRLLTMAGQLVRLQRESSLPDSLRLSTYRGALAGSIRTSLLREQSIDTTYEKLALAAWFRAAQSELPANDPFLRAALGGRTPEQAAAALVSGTRVGDLAFRRALLAGSEGSVAASTDPMIALARQVDPLNRDVLARTERLNAVIAANTELLGQALFETYGTALPPDATFTLRISDGIVKGYPMNGTVAPYKTTFFGMYARSAEFDGKPPFNLPARWINGMSRLDLTTPYDFVSTADIIGGNSGSPVLDRKGELVGLAFDSNIEGVANRFIFSSETQRTVSVSSVAVTEALRKMYGATRLADELERK